jgi:Pentapeptide repeats (8 copies)
VAQEPRTAHERALWLLKAALATPSWLPPTAGQRLVWVIRGAVVLGLLVLIVSAVDKTLWDWLGLLIVPLVLAIGGYLFNSSQNRATQRAAEQRAQDDTLQAYLDHISQLLNNEKQPLHRAQPGDRLSALARARTLTLLTRLDSPNRKRSVLSFLYETGLIFKERPVLTLAGADLSHAYLPGALLERAYLFDARLQGAFLVAARLQGADLRLAHLNDANLEEADLEDALLFGVDLREANLRGVKGADIEALKRQARSLEGATMPNGQKYEEWLKAKEGSGEDGEDSGPS